MPSEGSLDFIPLWALLAATVIYVLLSVEVGFRLGRYRRIADKEKEYKAIVLLTDGENHEPEAQTAADKAAKAGIRIFTIGIG